MGEAKIEQITFNPDRLKLKLELELNIKTLGKQTHPGRCSNQALKEVSCEA